MSSNVNTAKARAAQERALTQRISKAAHYLRIGSPSRGASPAPYNSLPDYQEIYYQPQSDQRRQDEVESNANRRQAQAVRNREKYGFHGVASPGNAAVLRYDVTDYPSTERRKNGKMQFVYGGPISYPQRLSPPDETAEEASEAQSQRLRRPQKARKVSEATLVGRALPRPSNEPVGGSFPKADKKTSPPKKAKPVISRKKLSTKPKTAKQKELSRKKLTVQKQALYMREGK